MSIAGKRVAILVEEGYEDSELTGPLQGLQAAGAIAASGHAKNLREGIGLAREAIDSGAAARRLEELIAFTHAEVAA